MNKELTQLTPVEVINQIWVKREDKFQIAGVCGGKARACYALANGANGLITAGSRQSPQVAIVSAIAAEMGIPCRVHVPSGKFTPELEYAQYKGANIVQHKPGYNSVIIKRALDDAKAYPKFTYIPFGMECWSAVALTQIQVQNLPRNANKIVVPVGSAMTLAGILNGLIEYEYNIPVLGIVIGADPTKRLDKYAPVQWREMVELVKSKYDYHTKVADTYLGDIYLDPIYEAKCFKYLEPNDLFWIVGIRNL